MKLTKVNRDLLAPQTYKEWILCLVNPYQQLNLIPQRSFNTELSLFFLGKFPNLIAYFPPAHSPTQRLLYQSDRKTHINHAF